MAMIPKRGLNVMKCETARLLKLTSNSIEPLSFVVPRKVHDFIFSLAMCYTDWWSLHDMVRSFNTVWKVAGIVETCFYWFEVCVVFYCCFDVCVCMFFVLCNNGRSGSLISWVIFVWRDGVVCIIISVGMLICQPRHPVRALRCVYFGTLAFDHQCRAVQGQL